MCFSDSHWIAWKMTYRWHSCLQCQRWWFCSSAWCYYGFLGCPRQPRVQWGSTTPCHFLRHDLFDRVTSWDILRHLETSWDILRHFETFVSKSLRTVFSARCHHMPLFDLVLSRLPEYRNQVTRLGWDRHPIYPHTWKGLQIFEILNRDRGTAIAKYKQYGFTEMDNMTTLQHWAQ